MANKAALNKAISDSEKWWRQQLKKLVNKKVTDYNKMERRAIRPGSMITFRYSNPKTPLKQLKAFDEFPLVIIFSIKGHFLTGINLHWTARPMREIIIKKIILMNRRNIKNNKRMDLDYYQIKEWIYRNGLQHTIIHKYIMPRMQNLNYVKASDWHHAIYVPSEKFVMDASMTQEDLYKWIYSHTRPVKTMKNKRKRYEKKRK